MVKKGGSNHITWFCFSGFLMVFVGVFLFFKGFIGFLVFVVPGFAFLVF